MDLNLLAVFVKVVEAGSLTHAAHESAMSTSGVSRALARLEQELGIRLLQRTTRKLSLTSAGRDYFEKVRGALAELNEATLAATNMGDDPRGPVRVTVPPAMTGILIPFLAEFLRRYPKITVELLSAQGIVDLVENGIDLAMRIGRLRDSSLIARRVAHMTTGLYATRGYVRRNGNPAKPEDLGSHNCVLFRARDGKDSWRLRNHDRSVSVEVSGSIQVDEIPSLHQAIQAGIGIGRISFLTSARMKGIVRVLPRYIADDLPISLVSPSRRLEPTRVVLLRDFLAAKLSSLPWRDKK